MLYKCRSPFTTTPLPSIGLPRALPTQYDADGSGQIELRELEAMVRGALKLDAKALSGDELKGLWATLDADKSGLVTIEEFVGFLRRTTSAGTKAAGAAGKMKGAHDRSAESSVFQARSKAASEARLAATVGK